MAAFVRLTEFLVAISVGVSAVSNYLIVNKLWSRKSQREVAESISISAALLGLATGLPFLVQFTVVTPSAAAAVKTVIGIATGVIIVTVGTGIWVADNRGVRFFTLFVRALKLEKKESTDLIKALVQPHGARELMEVFRAMAQVDRHVDERELAMMRMFAHRWRVELPDLAAGATDEGGDMVEVRRTVESYLAISPPAEQARELLDVLRLFVQADGHMSAEEDLMLDELTGLIGSYTGAHANGTRMHEVVIVPQDAAQTDAVRALLPGVEAKVVRGGRVYSVGRFFSPQYADMISRRYIDLGLFTALVEE